MSNVSTSELTRLLKNLRSSKGWSQEKLGEISKVSGRTIQRIEAGETQFTQRKIMEQLAEALGVSVDLFLKIDAVDVQQLFNDHPDETIATGTLSPNQDEDRNTDETQQPMPHQSSTWKRKWKIYVGIVALIFLVITTSILTYFFNTNTSQAPFEGAWVTPTKGETVKNIVHFAAYASPIKSTDPKVDHIIFTAWWQGVDPHHWENLCYAYKSDNHSIFRCDTNLRQFHALAGSILLSFDIYDKDGRARLSPDNEFTIHYIPFSLSS